MSHGDKGWRKKNGNWKMSNRVVMTYDNGNDRLEIFFQWKMRKYQTENIKWHGPTWKSAQKCSAQTKISYTLTNNGMFQNHSNRLYLIFTCCAFNWLACFAGTMATMTKERRLGFSFVPFFNQLTD